MKEQTENSLTRRVFLKGALVVVGTTAAGIVWSVLPTGADVVQVSSALDARPTLYLIADVHNDTQWNWTIQHTIQDCIPATMRPNWELMEKYPDYVFNYEGVLHYMYFKEYYPADWPELQQWVNKGRWRLSGSWINAVDVCIPSPESLFRQALYGQQFYRREFGKISLDIFLPDCFGFPYSLPSIGRHSGLIAFSTQKFEDWGGWRSTPFDIGRWRGPDGAEIISALRPGPYDSRLRSNIARDPQWNSDFSMAGDREVGLRYFGNGDQGGTPGDKSVSWMEKAVNDKDAPVRVINTAADQLAQDLTAAEIAALDVYDGELTMSTHGVGGYTSQAAHKKWNRANEQMADAAERASLAAAYLGGPAYPQDILSASWIRTLGHQFHDTMPGTCIPQAYTFVWNDDLINQSRLSQIMTTGVGAIAQYLNTHVRGIPLVIYNPLEQPRRDVVEATVTLRHESPAVRVYDTTTGAEAPSQMLSREGATVTLLILAHAPAVGCRVYDVRASSTPCTLATGLKVSEDSLESDTYHVTVTSDGDISSVYDKRAQSELLSAPSQLEQFHDLSPDWPAWEIKWAVTSNPPRGLVNENPRIRIAERGPVRVSLEVTRNLGDSTFVQNIRLTPGGDWVEIHNDVDWQTPGTLVKATFPMTASNPNATYDLGLGVIERPNADRSRYEVNAQEWADITDTSRSHGLAILTQYKYGFDKPDENTLRLSIIRTPDGNGNYPHQDTNDIGRHYFSYAMAGHSGDWRKGGIVQRGRRFNQPLRAFQTTDDEGWGERGFSLLQISTDQVSVRALKKAEASDEWIIRLQELHGLPAHGVVVTFIGPLTSIREINAIEDPIGTIETEAATLVVNLTPYQPRTFAVSVDPQMLQITPVKGAPVELAYNLNGITDNAHPTAVAFDDKGRSYPAELWPKRLTADGIEFHLGRAAAGANNMVECRGQKVRLPDGSHNRLYLLAAATDDEQHGDFLIHSPGQTVSTSLKVQDWAQLIGQWYSRIKSNDPDDPALFTPGTNDTGLAMENMDVKYILDGKVVNLDRLKPAFVKRDNIAWVGTHRHGPKGDMPYCFCYLFKYRVDLPAGATHITLPDNPRIRIMAMTAARNVLDETAPAGAMFEPEMGSVRITAAPKTQIVSTKDPVFELSATQSFDGTTNGFVNNNTADLPTDDGQPWTINMFVFVSQQPEELTILGGFGSGHDTSGTQRYLIKYNNVIHFWGSNIDINSSQPLKLGAWQMLTATFDGAKLTMYQDATPIGTAPMMLNEAEPIIKLGVKGPWPEAHKLNGKIAHFTIWNRCLPQTEIQTLTSAEPSA